MPLLQARKFRGPISKKNPYTYLLAVSYFSWVQVLIYPEIVSRSVESRAPDVDGINGARPVLYTVACVGII